MKLKFTVFFFTFILLSTICFAGDFTLNSNSFTDNQPIPNIYANTGFPDGKNISPELHWNNPPKTTKSFAIVCYDIHPVANNWIHWIVINIPSKVNNIKEGASLKNMPSNSLELKNSFGTDGYGGPQPPQNTGVHKYIFTIYALNTTTLTPNSQTLSIDDFQTLIKDKVISSATLSGVLSH